jgi:predicted GH43/DUF377 family glycosyl hydrolase
VVSRLFVPGQELVGGSESRAATTIERLLALEECEVTVALEELFARFAHRHDDLAAVFDDHAARVRDYLTTTITTQRRRLIGAAFTHEYSIEGAAICNPSLVAHPDQRGLATGSLRVVMSVRAVGEGHHSSIGFRSGVISPTGELALDAAHRFPLVGTVGASLLHGSTFHSLLHDLGVDGETASSVLNTLRDHFSTAELEVALTKLQTQRDTRPNAVTTARLLRLIASCFYDVTFDPGVDISRRVLWPAAPNEGNGMEDARFVEMAEPSTPRYLASYTAFDGHSVSQQLLATDDFVTFRSTPLAGQGARNKGLAFFPRRVDGRYVALSRCDRESNAVSFSDDLHRWDEVVTAQIPRHSWEVVQLGNCGSPIELAQGWLVLTHGVGPMRTYGIGALLLDLDDPTRVIGQLPLPLLSPTSEEQDGYVPNVVYSCGSLAHHGTLFIPFGIADQTISVASVVVSDVLDAMVPPS